MKMLGRGRPFRQRKSPPKIRKTEGSVGLILSINNNPKRRTESSCVYVPMWRGHRNMRVKTNMHTDTRIDKAQSSGKASKRLDGRAYRYGGMCDIVDTHSFMES